MIARPWHREPHLVREGGKEHFVTPIEALDEQFERAPRIGPPRIVCGTRFRVCRHAGADVEQNAKAHRLALGAELRDGASLAGIFNFELIGRQSGHEAAGPLCDRHRHHDDVAAGAEERNGLGS